MPISTIKQRLLFFLSLKACLMTAVTLYAGIELGPDEVQYWTWSRALDWGYYSKPPGIAWQIWLGTKLFGHTEWGVRSLLIALSFFQAWVVYLLALRSGLLPRTAFWCCLLMAYCPFGLIGSLLAITDVGFILCWSGACLTVASALHRKIEPNPLITGLWILTGALFKWPIYLFWFFYLLGCFWYFPSQKKGRLLGGIALSLLGLLPSLWWNWSHDWATIRHVLATLHVGGSNSIGQPNFVEFMGLQAALISPLLFLLLIAGCMHWLKQKQDLSPPLFFCGFVTLMSFSLMSLMSCFQKIQGNWAIFAYPTAIIILGWDSFQAHPKRAFWAKLGLTLSLTLSLVFIAFPSLYSIPALASYAPSYRLNPFFINNMGWAELKKSLKKHGYDPAQHFLAGDHYQTTSILSFYSEGQKRAYFLNINGHRKNQFSYWPGLLEEQVGATGYFVFLLTLPHLDRIGPDEIISYQSKLKSYFESVELLVHAPLLFEGTGASKTALIFRCRNCKDQELPESVHW